MADKPGPLHFFLAFRKHATCILSQDQGRSTPGKHLIHFCSSQAFSLQKHPEFIPFFFPESPVSVPAQDSPISTANVTTSSTSRQC